MCTYLSNHLQLSVKIKYSIQTNGTLIDNEWAHLFLKHKIGVGISLDGPEKSNDKYRIYHSGKGSHQAVVKGINILNQIYSDNSFGFAGTLCVINPQNSATEIYQHFSKDLKLHAFDFIIPDYTHDNPPPYPAKEYGKFLIDLFKAWIQDEDQTINIRVLSSSVGRFFGFNSQIYGIGKLENIETLLPLITISSNGDLSPLDELRSTDPRFRDNRKNIFSTSLKEFISLDIFKDIALASETLPEKCSNCCWSTVCEGGGLVERYSTENKFNNASVYCDGLMDFFAHIAKYLLDNGFPLQELEKNLLLNHSSLSVSA